MHIQTLILAAAWLRMHLQVGKWSTPEGALAWRWDLGVKQDSYSYTLAVYRVRRSRYVLRLLRSHGSATDLRSTNTLESALRVGQMLHRECSKAARIANERDMRAMADLAI